VEDTQRDKKGSNQGVKSCAAKKGDDKKERSSDKESQLLGKGKTKGEPRKGLALGGMSSRPSNMRVSDIYKTYPGEK